MSNMENIAVWIFDELTHAEKARHELIAAGFAADGIELVAMEDEAGPVEGNFILEYKDKEPAYSHKPSVFDPAKVYGDNPNDGLGHTPVVWRGNQMLIIVVEEPARIPDVAAIARQYGGVDVDWITAQANLSSKTSRPNL